MNVNPDLRLFSLQMIYMYGQDFFIGHRQYRDFFQIQEFWCGDLSPDYINSLVFLPLSEVMSRVITVTSCPLCLNLFCVYVLYLQLPLSTQIGPYVWRVPRLDIYK